MAKYSLWCLNLSFYENNCIKQGIENIIYTVNCIPGKMKVLMLLSNPFIFDARVRKEAKALTEAGHEVAVIVWDRKGDYLEEEIVEDIILIRIHNKGLMGVLPNDLFRNPIWWRLAYRVGLRLHRSGRFQFDIVHCHDLDTLQIGVWLKKKLGVPLIYDAHEIFGYMIARDMPKIIVKAAFLIEKKLIQYVDHIITVNEHLECYFRSICNKCVSIIMNCKDLIWDKYVPPHNDMFTLCYIGVLHKSRMFPEIVDIIGNMPKIKCIIAGKKENLYVKVKDRCKKYNNIKFLGTIPLKEVIPKTIGADATLCMINPNDFNNRIGVANKQFEAMVCGRPIVCTRGTYSGDMTKRLECGITTGYTANSLIDGIITLRDNPQLCEQYGRNALKAAKTKFNWGNEKQKLIELYMKIDNDKQKQ